MLSALLSSYSGSKHAGIRVDEGALCGIPNVCVHCEKYKVGKCGKGRDGYSVCKYDCVIYEAQKRIWFGLQIKELCSGWRMLRYDRPFLLTKSQFSYLLSYDQQLSLYAEAAAQAVDFSAKYDALIREMLSVLPNFDDGTWDKDLKVTTLSGESLSKLVNALNLLKAKRQSFGALLSIPKFNNILPYVAHGQVNNALILADERCLRCRHKSCSKGEAPIGLQDVSRCPNGVSYVKGFGRSYYGLKLLEDKERKRHKTVKVNKRAIMFSSSQLKRLLCFINYKEARLNEARRFLHDLGQYIASIQNLLPCRTLRHSNGPASISVSSLRSIYAMVLAMECLKHNLFRTSGKVKFCEFSVYQLFDKYRYCFYDICPDVNLIKEKQGFFEQLQAREGFEFVVLNLLSNAVKYLPPEAELKKIDITFKHTKKGALISVSSLGVVVDDDDLPKLGTRWFRGRRARASGVQGEGLGLYAIKEYMKQSGLGIKFKSRGKVVEYQGIEYRDFIVEIIIDKCHLKSVPADVAENHG